VPGTVGPAGGGRSSGLRGERAAQPQTLSGVGGQRPLSPRRSTGRDTNSTRDDFRRDGEPKTQGWARIDAAQKRYSPQRDSPQIPAPPRASMRAGRSYRLAPRVNWLASHRQTIRERVGVTFPPQVPSSHAGRPLRRCSPDSPSKSGRATGLAPRSLQSAVKVPQSPAARCVFPRWAL
jgi:hypothetical protein